MAMRVYGWKPDRPDFRDRMVPEQLVQAKLPPKFSLKDGLPPCYDQGELGSCTANALGGAVAYTLIKQKKLTMQAAASSAGTPSRLFIYYNERALEGTIPYDAGAYIRDGIKTLAKQGACFENTWPYLISQFTRKPSVAAYNNALPRVIKSYQRLSVADLVAKKTTITQGKPIVFGMSVYESFESEAVDSTGLVPMPQPYESLLGGHAMLIVGYDDTLKIGNYTGAFEVRNSWGGAWGVNGYCYIPYAYLTDSNLSDDHWIISTI